jgi:radical SAM protein with 4Fe4S-binding SPASM domain
VNHQTIKAKSGYSLGIGTTGDCNLNCRHCYSKPFRGTRLTAEQVRCALDGKDIDSINFGTGENILNPGFPDMIDDCFERGITLSLTSNGYSIMRLASHQLKKFNDIDVSLDFADRLKQNAFRGGDSWSMALRAVEKCRSSNVEVSITTTIMNINYEELPKILSLTRKIGCHLRVNIFKPVPQAGIFHYQLSFNEFWQAMKLLFGSGKLISCSEPIVNAMLDIPSAVPKSPCGQNSLRIHPDGWVVPCVYWTRSDVHIDALNTSFEALEQSANFKLAAVIPEFCQSCQKCDVCGGGCASRRLLNNRLNSPDIYCPVYRGKNIPRIAVEKSKEDKHFVHAAYLCTMIFE